MKTLLKAGIAILVILILLIIVSLFLPANVHVERTAVIEAEPSVIFVQVNDLHNWNNWMPWNKMDPKMKIDYFGPSEGKGSGYSWHSDLKEVGDGKLWITQSLSNQYIETEMEFAQNGPATGSFKFEKVDGGTKVTWGMDSDMGMNPVGKYIGLFMDQMVGEQFDKGLNDLKKTSESHPSAQGNP